MERVSHIIDHLGGPRRVASGLAVPLGTVAAWKHRESIPAEHWLALSKINSPEGAAITLEALATAHARAAGKAQPTRTA
jgi:hypothetical protein